MLRRIVVVGASLGGLRTGESLRRAGFEGELVFVGDERHQPYDRPPLSKSFVGSTDLGDPPWLRQAAGLSPRWCLGIPAVQLSPAAQSVLLADGNTLEYDGLVIATGLRARTLPAMSMESRRIHLLRSLDDVVRLRESLATARSLVIVGGGFIGAELASTARGRGMAVSIISPVPLLDRGLGPLAPTASARARRAGVEVLDDHTVVGLTASDGAVAVQLGSGHEVTADVAVVAIGAVPNIEWLADSGLKLGDGLLCDVSLAASGRDDIVGVGDVVSWPHPAAGGAMVRLEHWTNVTEQAQAAARRLLTGQALAFGAVPSFWTDQFGIRIQGVGLTNLADSVDVVDGDPVSDAFVAEYWRGTRLVGAVAAGSPAALLPYRREFVNSMRASLIG